MNTDGYLRVSVGVRVFILFFDYLSIYFFGRGVAAVYMHR